MHACCVVFEIHVCHGMREKLDEIFCFCKPLLGLWLTDACNGNSSLVNSWESLSVGTLKRSRTVVGGRR
jgi:hypothetical protein